MTDAIRNALRLAKQGRMPLHQAIARSGYDDGGPVDGQPDEASQQQFLQDQLHPELRPSPLVEQMSAPTSQQALAENKIEPKSTAHEFEQQVLNKQEPQLPQMDREAYERMKYGAPEVLHAAAYATPAAPVAAAYDLYQGAKSGDPMELGLAATGLPGKYAKAAAMGAAAMMPQEAQANYRRFAVDWALKAAEQARGIGQGMRGGPNLGIFHSTEGRHLPEVMRRFEGAIPAPSLAIGRPELEMSQFGDDILVGRPHLAVPTEENPIWRADAYTPRFPKIQTSSGDVPELLHNKATKFLETHGGNKEKAIADIREAYADNPLYGQGLIGYINDPEGYKLKEWIPKGVNDPTRVEPTAENVVAHMRSGNIAGGEGGQSGNAGGIGLVKALASPQFKTIEEIQQAGHDMPFDERGRDWSDILSELQGRGGLLQGKHVDPNSKAYTQNLNAAMIDYLRSGNEADFLKHYPKADKFDIARVNNLIDQIRQTPPSYFEAKPLRPVGIDEFAGALLPSSRHFEETKNALVGAGMDPKTIHLYDPGSPAMRTKILRERFGEHFFADGGEVDRLNGIKQRGLDTVFGKKRRKYATDGSVEGVPDETSQESFLKQQLEGSAPQSDVAAGELTAKRAGLMGAGMLPGSGIAAATGNFPTAEGGYEPSMRQDWQAGNYGSALMKGAGAIGDVAQAIPVVGTAAGAALKAPLAYKLAMAMTPAAKAAAKVAKAARGENAVEEAVPLAKKILDKAPGTPTAEAATIGHNGGPELDHVDAVSEPEIPKRGVDTGMLQGPVKFAGLSNEGDIPQNALKNVPYVNKEMLTENPYFPIFADLTSAGKKYEGIDSSKLQEAINTYGGPLYPLLHGNQLANLVWAVRGKGRGTSKISKPADYAVVLAMSPETHKSNTTFGNSLIQTMEAYGRDNRLSPENLSAINDMVRNPGQQKELAKLKDFPGFESPEAAKFIDSLSFEARKRIGEVLGSSAAQELGAPNMTKLIRELTEPQYSGYNRHDAMMLLKLAKDRKEGLVDLSQAGLPPHPDYPYGIHGEVVGQFPPGVSGRSLFPEYFTALDAENLAKQEAAAAKGEKARIGPERAFEMALPVQKLSAEAAAAIPLEKMNIQSPQAARLAVNAANDAWQDSATAVNKGGLSPAEFSRALQDSEYSSTLTPYTEKELKDKIKQGKFEGYKLKDGQVYFGLEPNKNYAEEYGFEHPDLGPNEKALVSVVNNEPGANGIGGPAVMFKALENGATVLDAYAVPSAAHPNGFLPQYYNKFGFEELGRIPFDPQYVTPQQLADMKRVWERDGWDESMGLPAISIMKWRGNDADRAGGLQRFIQSRSERAGQRSDIAAAAGTVKPGGRNAGRASGKAQGRSGSAIGSGDQGNIPNGGKPHPAEKLGRTLSESFRMTEPQTKSWGLDNASVLAARKKLLGYSSGGEVADALRLAKSKIGKK